MTDAQRRTVTVSIGGSEHQVSVTAEGEPQELMKLAQEAFHDTRPPVRLAAGFGPQYADRTHDRQPAGSPWHMNPTGAAGD